jgi:hypothetical protein
VKHKKSKRQKEKETLASVIKEMAQPRFAASARKAQLDANEKGTERASILGTVIPVV